MNAEDPGPGNSTVDVCWRPPTRLDRCVSRLQASSDLTRLDLPRSVLLHARLGQPPQHGCLMLDNLVFTSRDDVVDVLFRHLGPDPEHRHLRLLLTRLARRNDTRWRLLPEHFPAADDSFVGSDDDLAAAVNAALDERSEDVAAARGAAFSSWFSARRDAGEGVVGTVHARVKGGFAVDLGACRVFLPASQIADHPRSRLVGCSLLFRILPSSPRNVVVSLVDVPAVGRRCPLRTPVGGDHALPAALVDAVLTRQGRAGGATRAQLRDAILHSGLRAAEDCWRRWFVLDSEAAVMWAALHGTALAVTHVEVLRLRARFASDDELAGDVRRALGRNRGQRERRLAFDICRRRPAIALSLLDEVYSAASLPPFDCSEGCCHDDDVGVIGLAALAELPHPIAAEARRHLLARTTNTVVIERAIAACAWLGVVSEGIDVEDAVANDANDTNGDVCRLAVAVGRGDRGALTAALRAVLAGRVSAAVFDAIDALD